MARKPQDWYPDRAMVEFDHLPQKSRSLILATLALDIVSINCRSIFDLALRRNQTVNDVWRDICRRTAQPHCTMPRRILESQYTALPPASSPTPLFPPQPAASTARPAATAATAAEPASVMQFGDLLAISPAEPAARPAPAPCGGRAQPGDHRPRDRRIALTASIAALLLLAIGLAIVIAASDSTRMTAARFDEIVRVGAAPDRDIGSRSDVNVPEPQGTVRRIDAIGKAFSKQ
jgi:hypothetical protein